MLYNSNNIQLALGLLCIALVLQTLLCQEPAIIIVQPEHQPASQCPISNCCRLTTLIKENILSGDISNTTIVFQPGTHTVVSMIEQVVLISAVNFTLKASDPSVGATILCNGPIGFSFKYCTNMKIVGITFINCGARGDFESKELQKLKQHFTLHVHLSKNVQLRNISIMNGTGIGLVIEDIRQNLLFVNSVISECDTGIFMNLSDHSAIVSNLTTVQIVNCSVSRTTLKSNKYYYSAFGVTLVLQQTQFHANINIRNVSLSISSMNVRLITCNNNININYIKSFHNLKNLWTNIALKCRSATTSKSTTAFTMDRAWFTREGMRIEGISTFPSSKYSITFSNVCISESRHIAYLAKVRNITFRNTTITHCDRGYFDIIGSNVNFDGHFSFKWTKGRLRVRQRSNLSFYNNSKVFIGHNLLSSSEQFYNLLQSPMYVINSNIKISSSYILFENNTGVQCGGMTLVNSFVTFIGESNVIFSHNHGRRGGAMAFYLGSQLKFKGGVTKFTFKDNHASIVGGGIYVQDVEELKENTFIIDSYKKFFTAQSKEKPTFIFKNNTAVLAGSALYGGIGNNKDFTFDNTHKTDFSVGSTNPYRVCLCNNSIPNCGIRVIHDDIYPGQTYEIEAVAVGEWNGTVPSKIQMKVKGVRSAGVHLKETENIQIVGKTCTKLTFTLQYAKLKSRTTDVYPQIINTYHRFQDLQSKAINLQITLHAHHCTVGFSIDKIENKCSCNQVLRDHGIKCDIQTLTVKRLSPFWINATYIHLPLEELSGVIVHDHCPYDYCKSTSGSASQSLSLNSPNEQCASHRSGILCGKCEVNFSLVLGTSNCKQCSDRWIALVITIFVIAGVALILVLSYLNITVTSGTISGLIFYANILDANKAIYFPHEVSNMFLSVFIAWLNLDLGFELCFYNGLDVYAKTWLRFLFPSYILLMVVVIILVSHYSSIFSRIVGNNAVQVLATLFLLSYAKLLQLIITIFSSTSIVYPNGYANRVWLYDGNVDYLKGKHIPLFIAAVLLLVCVSIPYTATLFCIQWLQKLSHKTLFSWVGSMLPLFDAHTGPYKFKHRYWTGLLLLVRVFLFLVYSLNSFGDTVVKLNLLLTSACMFILLTYLSLTGGVYKNAALNLVEISFIMNLGILSMGALYSFAASTSIKPISFISVAIAFITFIGITVYHAFLKTMKFSCTKKVIQTIKTLIQRTTHQLSDGIARTTEQTEVLVNEDVTYSEIVLEDIVS